MLNAAEAPVHKELHFGDRMQNRAKIRQWLNDNGLCLNSAITKPEINKPLQCAVVKFTPCQVRLVKPVHISQPQINLADYDLHFQTCKVNRLSDFEDIQVAPQPIALGNSAEVLTFNKKTKSVKQLAPIQIKVVRNPSPAVESCEKRCLPHNIELLIYKSVNTARYTMMTQANHHVTVSNIYCVNISPVYCCHYTRHPHEDEESGVVLPSVFLSNHTSDIIQSQVYDPGII